MVIYGDNAGLVDTGDELFRTLFGVPNDTVDWQGVTGGSLFTLNQGTYWVAIESNLNELTAILPTPPPNPLAAYAANIGGAGYGADGSQYGFRLEGDLQETNVIPEPATMLLFGSGMAGMFLRRRKRS